MLLCERCNKISVGEDERCICVNSVSCMSVHQYICWSSHLDDGRRESSPVPLNTRTFECKYRPYSCTRTLRSRKHRPSFRWTLQFWSLAAGTARGEAQYRRVSKWLPSSSSSSGMNRNLKISALPKTCRRASSDWRRGEWGGRSSANAQFSFNEDKRCWRIACWGKRDVIPRLSQKKKAD